MTAVLVALMAFLFSIQSLFSKLFSQKYKSPDTALTSTVFSIGYGVFAGLATLVTAGFKFAPSAPTLLFGGLNAVMLLVYNTAMIQASRCGAYAFQMIAALFGSTILPMLYGVLFLGESLTAVQVVAVVFMLISFVLINFKDLSLKGTSGKYFFWCFALFVSNGFYGIMQNLQGMAMNGAERNEMVILTFLGMSVLYAVIQLIRSPKKLAAGLRMPLPALICLIVSSASATVGAHMMLYMLTKVSETVLFTVTNGGIMMLSVMFSRLLFHERMDAVKLFGIALSVAGIVMLSL